MSTAAQASLTDRWADALAALQPVSGPAWLQALRQTAAGHFRSSGLPHRKIEAWKYTPLKAVESLALETASNEQALPMDLPPSLGEGAALVDFVDGRLSDTLPLLPPGVTLLPLTAGIARFEDRVKPLFEGVELGGATSAFNALNTACADQGFVVHVAAGVDAGTLAIRWAFSANHGEAMSHPRLLILLDEGARLDLLEQYQSAADVTAGLNVLTQAELGARSRLHHTLVQAESERAVVMTSTMIHQAEDSRYSYHGFDLGAGLARHEITALLMGAGASADIAGAFVLGGRRHADHHVNVEHRARDCRSEQFFRGVLGGRSRGVFNGRALIQPGADGSSVRQSNANLLLSPLAEIDTKPELEIYADEVEASHGATVGQLDETAVFYLRSRGLSEADARRLLTTAFCHAVSDRLEDRALAGRIAVLMDAAMPTDTDV
jgi:Fe-S cluster assembly protein SufD